VTSGYHAAPPHHDHRVLGASFPPLGRRPTLTYRRTVFTGTGLTSSLSRAAVTESRRIIQVARKLRAGTPAPQCDTGTFARSLPVSPFKFVTGLFLQRLRRCCRQWSNPSSQGCEGLCPPGNRCRSQRQSPVLRHRVPQRPPREASAPVRATWGVSRPAIAQASRRHSS
jgi:hypothetical protein